MKRRSEFYPIFLVIKDHLGMELQISLRLLLSKWFKALLWYFFQEMWNFGKIPVSSKLMIMQVGFFIAQLRYLMSFDARMSHLTFMLGVGSVSHILMANYITINPKFEFNCMENLDMMIIQNVVLESCWHIMVFRIVHTMFHISHGYDYIWWLVVVMPMLMVLVLEFVVEGLWNNWLFDYKKSKLLLEINYVYHKLIENRTWLVMKVSHPCHIAHCMEWWHWVVDVG